MTADDVHTAKVKDTWKGPDLLNVVQGVGSPLLKPLKQVLPQVLRYLLPTTLNLCKILRI